MTPSKGYAGDHGQANRTFDLACQGSEKRLHLTSPDSGETRDRSRNIRISLNLASREYCYGQDGSPITHWTEDGPVYHIHLVSGSKITLQDGLSPKFVDTDVRFYDSEEIDRVNGDYTYEEVKIFADGRKLILVDGFLTCHKAGYTPCSQSKRQF